MAENKIEKVTEDILAIQKEQIYNNGDIGDRAFSIVDGITLDDETNNDSVRDIIFDVEKGAYSYEQARRVFEDVFGKEVILRTDYGAGQRAEQRSGGRERGKSTGAYGKIKKFSRPCPNLLKCQNNNWRNAYKAKEVAEKEESRNVVMKKKVIVRRDKVHL